MPPELKADFALVCDTSMWDRDTPAISSACAGSSARRSSSRAADRDLHSGYFGGAAANPIHILANILAGLHDETGRVTLQASTRASRKRLRRSRHPGKRSARRPRTSSARSAFRFRRAKRAARCWNWSGRAPPPSSTASRAATPAKGFKTVIAAQASAKVSFRLVHKQNPDKIRAAFRAFVRGTHPGRLLGRIPRAWRLAGNPALL